MIRHHQSEADEMAMIGSMIFDPRQADIIMATVGPEDLFDEQLSEFYSMLIDLHELRKPIDDPTLVNTERRRRKLAISAGTVAEIFSSVPNAQHAHYYAKNVAECSRLRRLSLVRDTIRQGLEDPSQTSERILGQIEADTSLVASRSQVDLVGAQQAVEIFSEAKEREVMAWTGYQSIDENFGGMSAGEFVVIAGRLGTGKTAMGWQICHHNATRKRPVLFVSLEMNVEQLMQRHLASTTCASAIDIRSGDYDESLVQEEKARFAELPFCQFVPATATVRQIAAAARLMQSGRGLSLVCVDYIGKIKPAQRAKDRTAEIAEISSDLKTLSRQLQVPVIGLCQLNRAAEEAKEIRVSHLAESDSIGRDADQVILLDRDRQAGTTTATVKKHRFIEDNRHVNLIFRNGKFVESSEWQP